MTILGTINNFIGNILGDGETVEEANDVRYLTHASNGAQTTLRRNHPSAPAEPHKADDMFSKLSHATPHTLPPNPWAAPSPSPPPQVDGSIDLTSPESPIAIYEDGLLPDTTQSRFEQRPNHAKRRKSSGAIPVPNPASGYQGPVGMGKPGAGKGFVPINNFNGSAIADRNNPAYGSRKQHTTYGKHDRNAKSIGIQRHSGQQKYLERNPGHKPATSHGSSPSYSSPVKRRKTEHPNPVPESLHTVLEIDDSEEDEIQQLPAQHASTPRAQSILSSRSPHSTTSKRSGAGSKPASQPTSEFANTDSFLQPKRVKSSRRRGSKGPNDRRAAQDEVPFLSSGSLSQARSVTDEGFEESLTTTRSIFDGFEQGVHQNPSRHNQPQQAMERVTSKHFPTMRINESTAETENHATQAPRGGSQTTRNLRDYQPTGFKIGGDLVEGSDDELAQPTPDIMKARRKKSPSIHVQKGRGAPDLESLTGECYRLDYARSYDLQAESKKLMLRQIKNDAKIFRLADEDPEGNVETIDEVNLSKINAVTSDNLTRMRIMGPFKNGSRYWFDLKFEDRNEFREFLHTWVLPEAVQKHVYTDKVMMDLFKKPLEKNDKIGKSPMVNEKLPSAQAQYEQQLPSKTTLLDTLLNRPRRDNTTIASERNSVTHPSAATRTQTRLVRSTRATAPTYDKQTPPEASKVYKHSVEVGLGSPWNKELVFHGGDEGFLRRRTGIVNWTDLSRLDEEEFLNDNLINFYMLYLYNQLKVSTNRVYFFTTQFFERLTQNTKGRDAINYDAVKSWTKRDDIFSYDYIVVPINENLHWYLAIVCNVSKIARKPAMDDLEVDIQNSDQAAISNQMNGVAEKQGHEKSNAKPCMDTDTVPAMEEPPVEKALLDEDENLFEEEKKLSLIDRDDAGSALKQQPPDQEEPADQQLPQEETTTAALLSAQAEKSLPNTLPPDGRQAPKKNTKRKVPVQKRDPDNPVIVILDSMSLPHSNVTRALREWLQAEGLERRGMTVEIDNKGFYPKAAHIPTQTNFTDCGLYVLGYAGRFFKDPDEFRVKLLTGQMSAETDWPDLDPSRLRNELRELLQKLYVEQSEARHRAKKAAKAKSTSSSPTKGGSKRTSPTVQQSSTINAAPSAGSNTLKTRSEKEQLPDMAQHELDAPSTAALHLGSPFVPNAETDRDRSCSVEDVEKDLKPRPVSPTETCLTAPTRVTPARPKHTHTKRLVNPEVRVPAKLPHIDRASYVRYDGAVDPSHQPAQQSTDLTSSLQRQELRSNDDGKLRMPSLKQAPASSPSRSPRRRPVLSSPPQPRPRSGSHDDPITLDDSQDLDAPMQQRARTTKKPPPEVIELDRSQESVTAPTRRSYAMTQSSPFQRKSRPQAVERDDSIQEVHDYEWREGRDITHAQRASLEDARRRRSQQSNSPLHEPDHPIDELYYGQRACLEPSHTLQGVSETQAMDLDNDDRVVSETPERQRSSPGANAGAMEWQAGSQLP